MTKKDKTELKVTFIVSIIILSIIFSFRFYTKTKYNMSILQYCVFQPFKYHQDNPCIVIWNNTDKCYSDTITIIKEKENIWKIKDE